MKPIALLLLASCGAAPAAADVGSCSPPDFYGPGCVDPGGGIRRCHMPDGTYWDHEPWARKDVHWRYVDYDGGEVVQCSVETCETLCEVPE